MEHGWGQRWVGNRSRQREHVEALLDQAETRSTIAPADSLRSRAADQAWLFLSLPLLVYLAGLWIGFHLFVIGHEEPTLRPAGFGETYDAYLRTVPLRGSSRPCRFDQHRQNLAGRALQREGGARSQGGNGRIDFDDGSTSPHRDARQDAAGSTRLTCRLRRRHRTCWQLGRRFYRFRRQQLTEPDYIRTQMSAAAWTTRRSFTAVLPLINDVYSREHLARMMLPCSSITSVLPAI